MRSLGFVALLTIAIPGAGWSQSEAGRLWGPRESPLFAAKPPQGIELALNDTTPRQIRRTYWQEGAIVGGVIVGLLGASFAGGMCSYSETRQNCNGATIGGLVMGAAVGVSVGALLGGQFHKPTSTRNPDPTKED